MTLSEDLPFTALRRTWQPVALAAALAPKQLLAYTLLGVELVVARFPDGTLLAADVACPHKGARLSAGCFHRDALRCSYHGWRFSAAGECLDIPSLVSPNPAKQALAHLRTYAIREKYGMIWVRLDSSESSQGTVDHPMGNLPDIPEFEDPRWTYTLGPATPFRAGWRREVENYLDMTHFAFAHATTLGAAADVRLPEMTISLHADGGFQMDAPFPALEAPHEPPGKLQSAHQRM